MKQSDFYKVGAEKRQDQVINIGVKNYLLIYGYGTDEDGNGYNFRKNYDHNPSEDELVKDVIGLINQETDRMILQGFKWNGKNVWLSLENQINFRAQYDLCIQTDGMNLPLKLKLGEREDGVYVYHTFETKEELADFYSSQVLYVHDVLLSAWNEKDSFVQKLKEIVL